MRTGVYMLTFPSGNRYIGKSIDIDERWKQHLDKMRKGKAAANMQREWNLYQTFTPQVLLECHSDHIDTVEACFIARWGPELNSVRPADPYQGISGDELDEVFVTFDKSSIDLVRELASAKRTVLRLDKKLSINAAELQEAYRKRSKEELKADLDNKIEMLEDMLESTVEANKVLQLRVQYLNKPWWERIFN